MRCALNARAGKWVSILLSSLAESHAFSYATGEARSGLRRRGSAWFILFLWHPQSLVFISASALGPYFTLLHCYIHGTLVSLCGLCHSAALLRKALGALHGVLGATVLQYFTAATYCHAGTPCCTLPCMGEAHCCTLPCMGHTAVHCHACGTLLYIAMLGERCCTVP